MKNSISLLVLGSLCAAASHSSTAETTRLAELGKMHKALVSAGLGAEDERYHAQPSIRERVGSARRKHHRTAKFMAGFAGHQRFARYHARKLSPAWSEDLAQEALIAGLRAAQRWDPRRPASMKTYVRRRISGAVIDAARRMLGDRRLKHPAPLLVSLEVPA